MRKSRRRNCGRFATRCAGCLHGTIRASSSARTEKLKITPRPKMTRPPLNRARHSFPTSRGPGSLRRSPFYKGKCMVAQLNLKEFVKTLRADSGDVSELRESFRRFGWVKYLPAIVDENGLVLVGNRRLKAAKLEGIEPIILTVTLGQGDAADAERLKLALASNLGGESLTKEDRKRIAEHLYGKKEWTMERIVEALNVAQSTITEDLRNLSTVDKSNLPRPRAIQRGRGDPKARASRLRPRAGPMPLSPWPIKVCRPRTSLPKPASANGKCGVQSKRKP